MSAVTLPPSHELTGWRYPRTQPSLPESHATVMVPRRIGFWRKALAFASERAKMGPFANGPALKWAAWTVAVVIMGLNTWLLVGTFREWLA